MLGLEKREHIMIHTSICSPLNNIHILPTHHLCEASPQLVPQKKKFRMSSASKGDIVGDIVFAGLAVDGDIVGYGVGLGEIVGLIVGISYMLHDSTFWKQYIPSGHSLLLPAGQCLA